jgi:hypothetical protein
MGFRLRRSARLGPLRVSTIATRANGYSKGGTELDLGGGRGATVGLPGTGLSWSVEHTPDRPSPFPADVSEGLPNSCRQRARGQQDADGIGLSGGRRAGQLGRERNCSQV